MASKKLGGVDVAKVVNQQIGAQIQGADFDATLTSYTAGEHTTGSLTAGRERTSTTHTAKGFIDSYRQRRQPIDGDPTSVRMRDKKIALLANSISPTVVPKPGDEIAIEGIAYVVVNVTRDPAGATYECQSRGR